MRFATDGEEHWSVRADAAAAARLSPFPLWERKLCCVAAMALILISVIPDRLRAQGVTSDAPKKGAPPDGRGRIDNKGGVKEGGDRQSGAGERKRSKSDSSTDSSNLASHARDGESCTTDEERDLREGYRAAFEGTGKAVYLLAPLILLAGVAVLIVVFLNRRTIEISRTKKALPSVEPDKNDKGEYVID